MGRKAGPLRRRCVMRVAIAGGGLQGVELCWLARKAGWETLLVDRRPAPPALRLADGFVQADVTRLEAEGREAAERMAGADIVIPALEDAAALEALGAWCARRGLPFAFDPDPAPLRIRGAARPGPKQRLCRSGRGGEPKPECGSRRRSGPGLGYAPCRACERLR